MLFVLPQARHEAAAREFLAEFSPQELPLSGGGGLDRYLEKDGYAAWLDKLQRDVDLANIPAERVPALTYFYVRKSDARIVGMINIRLALTDFLMREGGNIGYCVRPSERGKGYACAMLGGAAEFCARFGIKRLLLGCAEENRASQAVIEHCGGYLDRAFYSDFFHMPIRRYILETTDVIGEER